MSGSESSVRGSDELSLYKSESLLKRKKKKSFQAIELFYSPFISCQTIQTCSNSWSFCVSAAGYVSTDGANGIIEINIFCQYLFEASFTFYLII